MIKPIILQEGVHALDDLEQLKQSHPIWKTVDRYTEQLTELFEIQNPAVKFSPEFPAKLREFLDSRAATDKLTGAWVYYPWSGVLVHTLSEQEFELVATNRNRNIITAEEQDRLRAFTAGFIGLSIGNGMALNTIYSGMSKSIKIADFDALDLSNLNRIRAGLPDLGKPKTDITAEQIYQANPYANITAFESGLKAPDLDNFFGQAPQPQVIFEAIDDFEMKIRVRQAAKQHRVPVIMLTNLGDRLMVDVERYDLDPNLEIFNGLIGDTADQILSGQISESDKQKYAVAIVGRENIPTRVMETISEIGKTLVARPQVMGTVSIGGGVAPYLIRRICLRDDLPSGRYLFEFDKFISK